MAGSITIRNVPDEIRAELAARAARQSQSLQEFLITQLRELTEHPPLEVVLERARARARASGTRLSAEDILSARDADRK